MEQLYSVGKPKHKELFKQDLISNIQNRSNNYTKSLFINDIVKEAIMYSCDICLEFDNNSGGLLTKDWTQHIVSEVCDAMEELVKEFDASNRKTVMTRVLGLMNCDFVDNKPFAKRDVDKYYNRV